MQRRPRPSPTRRHVLAGGLSLAALPATDPLRAFADTRKPQRRRPRAKGVTAPPSLAVAALNRMGFGPWPGDIEAFNALGSTDAARLQAYIDRQLDPASIDDAPFEQRLADAAYQTLGKSRTQLWADHVLPSFDVLPWFERIRPLLETEAATFLRGVYSRKQLVEVLADFWHNHFNVFAEEFPIYSMFVHYDREVIRANLLGNFRQMLEDVAQSVCMLYFLDNVESSDDGPNENFARELLELHTLGVENYYGVGSPDTVPTDSNGDPLGYVDNDVFEAARSFTGWTVANGHWSDENDPDNGSFYYRDFWHDRFSKLFLGRFIPANQPALKDGRDVLDMLAAHRGTAQHVCAKLCRRFIADDPPQRVIDAAADVFADQWQAPDQLAQVYRVILESPEFAATWGGKVKRPLEIAMSAMRAGAINLTFKPDDTDAWTPTEQFVYEYAATGQRLFHWPAPNGYPDEQAAWLSSTAMIMSFRTVNRLLNIEHADDRPVIDVIQPTLDALTADRRTAQRLAEFWLQRILGYLPDSARVDRIARFMAQEDHETPTAIPLDEPIDITVDEWPHYHQSRLRAMVGLVLMSPELLDR